MKYHESRVQVRFNEVDQWGVVWYANYFAYIEVARSEVLAKVGLLPDVLSSLGYTAPIINLTANYKSSARFHDELVVQISLVPQKVAKLVFTFRIIQAESGVLVMEGESTQVLLNKKGFMVYTLAGELAEKIGNLQTYFKEDGENVIP
ncbi:MAG: acyl-CoA thioesterase [Proteobacteria bacterium]|nr:acyl-CoA thioesterase [Pseudomonadota bacterium]MBU1639520.1 acyl-CoA thioesterase [Pseudomonadota bacterium]